MLEGEANVTSSGKSIPSKKKCITNTLVSIKSIVNNGNMLVQGLV